MRLSPRCATIGAVADGVDLWDLLGRLDAASADADLYHHDLCSAVEGQPCSCGAGRLFIDAAAFLRAHVVEQTVRQAQQAA